MKKMFSKILMFCLLLVIPFGFVSCKKEAVVESYEILNVQSEVSVNGTIDLSNAKLKLNMSNGIIVYVSIADSMVIKPNLSTPGEKTLIVMYGGVNYEFKINVVLGGNSGAVTIVDYEFLNAKTTYLVGSSFSTENLKLKLIKSDGTTEIIDVTTQMVSAPSFSTLGEKVVVVTYQGKQYNLTVNVLEIDVQSFLNKFLAQYIMNDGADNINFKLFADLKANLLNEKGEVNEELLNFIVSKEDVKEDDLFEMLYNAFSDGLFFESLNGTGFDVINNNQFEAYIDALSSLFSVYSYTSDFNVVDYVLNVIAPNGTDEYVDRLVSVLSEELKLNSNGKNKLDVLLTINIHEFRNNNTIDATKLILDFEDIVLKYSSDDYIKSSISAYVQATIKLSDGSKDVLSTFIKEGLKNYEFFIYRWQTNDVQEIEKLDSLNKKVYNNIVNIVVKLENFDSSNVFDEVNYISNCISAILSACDEASEVEDIVSSSLNGSYDELMLINIVLNEYTGNLISDIYSIFKELQVLDIYLSMISNDAELNEKLIPVIYDLIEGNEVNEDDIISIVEKTLLNLGMEQEIVDEYVSNYKENGSTNILTAELEKARLDIIDYLMSEEVGMSVADSLDLYNYLVKIAGIYENIGTEFNFAELTYNIHKTCEIVLYFEPQNEPYGFNESGVGEVEEIVSSFWNKITMYCSVFYPLTKTEYDAGLDTYTFDFVSNYIDVLLQKEFIIDYLVSEPEMTEDDALLTYGYIKRCCELVGLNFNLAEFMYNLNKATEMVLNYAETEEVKTVQAEADSGELEDVVNKTWSQIVSYSSILNVLTKANYDAGSDTYSYDLTYVAQSIIYNINAYITAYKEALIEELTREGETQLSIDLASNYFATLENLTSVGYDEVKDEYYIDLKDNFVYAMASYKQYVSLVKEQYLENIEAQENTYYLHSGREYIVLYEKAPQGYYASNSVFYYHELPTGYYVVENPHWGKHGILGQYTYPGYSMYLENGKYYELKPTIVEYREGTYVSTIYYPLINTTAIIDDYGYIEYLNSELVEYMFDIVLELLNTEDNTVNLYNNLMRAIDCFNNLCLYVYVNTNDEALETLAEILLDLTVVEIPGDDVEFSSTSGSEGIKVLASEHIEYTLLSQDGNKTYLEIIFNEEGQEVFEEVLESSDVLYIRHKGQVLTSFDCSNLSNTSSLMLSFSMFEDALDFKYMIDDATIKLGMDLEFNIYCAFMELLNVALNNSEALTEALINILAFEEVDADIYEEVKLFVEEILIDLELERFDIEKTIDGLMDLVDKYSYEEAKTIISTMGILYAVYVGEEDISYNELFASIPLPEGISIDYDVLISKLKENKKEDLSEIITFENIKVDYIYDNNQKLIKEVLTFDINLNLDASLPATEGFNEFVLAMLDGKLTFVIELNI